MQTTQRIFRVSNIPKDPFSQIAKPTSSACRKKAKETKTGTYARAQTPTSTNNRICVIKPEGFAVCKKFRANMTALLCGRMEEFPYIYNYIFIYIYIVYNIVIYILAEDYHDGSRHRPHSLLSLKT